MKDQHILDLWAIQKDPNELYIALDNIKNDVIIFKNCICVFKIGKKLVETRQFDTIIYSEESDTMIMLMRGGKATSDMAEEYLDQHNINYDIVNFIDLPQFECDDNMKEFWFAREMYVLENAIDDSIKKAETSCKYDPNIKSKLIFKYLLNNGDAPMLKIVFRGLIEFQDKYILPTFSYKDKNLQEPAILKALDYKNIDVEFFDAETELNI